MANANLDSLLEGEEWMRLGACKGHPTELFFSPEHASLLLETGKQICNSCPVRKLCLEYAIENRIEHGTWGGESPRGRRKIAAQRKRKATS